MRVSHFSHVQLFVAPRTVAHQAPLSMGFSRQQYWSRLPFPTPGGLPDPGIKPESSVSPALADGFFTTEPPGKPQKFILFQFWRPEVQNQGSGRDASSGSSEGESVPCSLLVATGNTQLPQCNLCLCLHLDFSLGLCRFPLL